MQNFADKSNDNMNGRYLMVAERGRMVADRHILDLLKRCRQMQHWESELNRVGRLQLPEMVLETPPNGLYAYQGGCRLRSEPERSWKRSDVHVANIGWAQWRT